MKEVFVFWKFYFTFIGDDFSPKDFEINNSLKLDYKTEKGDRNEITGNILTFGKGSLMPPNEFCIDHPSEQQQWVEDFIKNQFIKLNLDIHKITEIELNLHIYTNTSVSLGWSSDFLILLGDNNIDFIQEIIYSKSEIESLQRIQNY